MPQSLIKNYIHIYFSTKNRKPWVETIIRDELYAYIEGVCTKFHSAALVIGGTTDHVHLLCEVSEKIPLSKLIEEIKSHSTLWVKGKGSEYQSFFWQNGHTAFSINPTEIAVVSDYIRYQTTLHKKKTFQQESRAFLKKYNVEYDERYVWD